MIDLKTIQSKAAREARFDGGFEEISSLESEWKRVWRQLKRTRLAIPGGLAVLFFIGVAVFAPVLAPYDPFKNNLAKPLLSPNTINFLGTDELGRDILSR